MTLQALTTAAGLAQTLAPLLSNLMQGNSRSSRKRNNKNPVSTLPKVLGQVVSYGQKGPSTAVPRGRSRPNKKGKQPGKPSGLSKGRGGTSTSLPAIISGRNFQTMYKQIGSPVHKEWGQGTRYMGVSVVGSVLDSPTDVVITPLIAQAEDQGSYTRYYDLYASLDTGSGQSLASRVFALHPAFITRLQSETYNWGRYCFRSVRFHSEPQSSTSQSRGWIIGSTHDTAWPLNVGQAESMNSGDIAELDNHCGGSFYESMTSTINDYTGDSTWPTTLPVADVVDASPNKPEGSYLEGQISSTYQHCWAAMKTDSSVGSNTFHGWLYVSYVIDFYGAKYDTTNIMTALSWNDGPISVSRKKFCEPLRRHPFKHLMEPGQYPAHALVADENRRRMLLKSVEPSVPTYASVVGTKVDKESIPPQPELKRIGRSKVSPIPDGKYRSRSLERVLRAIKEEKLGSKDRCSLIDDLVKKTPIDSELDDLPLAFPKLGMREASFVLDSRPP